MRQRSTAQELRTKAKYNKRPSVQKKRVANNKARRQALRDGRVQKGDAKDVHHKKPLDKGGSNKKSNTKVVSQKSNRGWRKKNPEMYTRRKKK